MFKNSCLSATNEYNAFHSVHVLLTNKFCMVNEVILNIAHMPHGKERGAAVPIVCCHVDVWDMRKGVVMGNRCQKHLNTDQKVLE